MCLRMAEQVDKLTMTLDMRSRDISRDEDFFQHIYIYGIWMAFRIPGLNLSGKDSSGNWFRVPISNKHE